MMHEKEKRQMPPRNFLAETLRDWRSKNDWPLKKVASEFGITKGTWSRWESGIRFPSLAHLRRLSDFLRVPICDLIYGHESRCPSCAIERSPLALSSSQDEGRCEFPVGKISGLSMRIAPRLTAAAVSAEVRSRNCQLGEER